jgi:catechol 2,3-dioxygenase-like lactoylglutathione lyase family enzyme
VAVDRGLGDAGAPRHLVDADAADPARGQQLEGGIVALATSAATRRFNNDAAVAAANRSAILEFEVDDVDAERARLDDKVTDWVQEPTTQPWGNRSMLFRDPDGNLVNVYSTGH